MNVDQTWNRNKLIRHQAANFCVKYVRSVRRSDCYSKKSAYTPRNEALRSRVKSAPNSPSFGIWVRPLLRSPAHHPRRATVECALTHDPSRDKTPGTQPLRSITQAALKDAGLLDTDSCK